MYKLAEVMQTIDWQGKKVNNDEYNKIKIGTVVRLMLEETDFFCKYYFKVNDIKNDNYGKVYYGSIIDNFNDNYNILLKNKIISWRNENILEIINWRSY
jgi:hypothetical protein